MSQPIPAPPVGRTLVNRIRIAAPATMVFELLADPVRELEWNEQLLAVDPLVEGPLGAGTRFRARFAAPVGDMVLTYDEFDAPFRWRTHGESKRLDVAMLGSIVETDGASEVTLTTTLAPKGLLRPLGPVVARTLTRAWDRHLSEIRQTLEPAAPTAR